MPRTCKVASWEPNEVYEVLHETSVISEEGQEETFNRFLKPAAPPDSGNGVGVSSFFVTYHERAPSLLTKQGPFVMERAS